ncbi:MAG: RNA polymerase sigma factor [Acidimicrobiales bacterium]
MERSQFEDLYSRYFDDVFAYTLVRADVELAKEATATTFLVAWRRRNDIPNDPKPWLLGVARRCLADERRARTRRLALDTRLRASTGQAEAWAWDPAREVVEQAVALSAFASLKPPDREILVLICWDGLTHPEAAAVLGCGEISFRVRLHRARSRFDSALAHAETDSSPASATRRARPKQPRKPKGPIACASERAAM